MPSSPDELQIVLPKKAQPKTPEWANALTSLVELQGRNIEQCFVALGLVDSLSKRVAALENELAKNVVRVEEPTDCFECGDKLQPRLITSPARDGEPGKSYVSIACRNPDCTNNPSRPDFR